MPQIHPGANYTYTMGPTYVTGSEKVAIVLVGKARPEGTFSFVSS